MAVLSWSARRPVQVPRRTRTRLGIVWFRFLIALLAPACAHAAAPRPQDAELELKVKAAFVLNFARYVEWPPKTFPTLTSEVVIGILGDDPFGKVIDDTVRGKKFELRPVTVRRFSNVGETTNACHLLFVSASEKGKWPRIFDQLASHPILTVSDVDGFIEAGGMINLKRRQDMLRFDVNRAAAERCGIKISSKLLKLADNSSR